MTWQTIMVWQGRVLIPRLHTLPEIKFLLDLQDHLIVVSVADLQLAEKPFQVVEVSGHEPSPCEAANIKPAAASGETYIDQYCNFW